MARNKKKPSETRPKIKKSHGWYVGVFIAGMLLPPIAVAMRFGFTRDFFINVVLTIMGYFPSHFHNYLQNIRNNTGRGRTPRWAIEHGLIEPDKVQSLQWQNRYAERTHENIYENDEAASIHSAGSNRDTYASIDVAAGGEGPRKGRRRKGGIEEARRNRYAGGTAKPYGAASGGTKELERRQTDDSLQLTTSRHSFTAAPPSSSSQFDSYPNNPNNANDDSSNVLGGGGGRQKKKPGMLKGLFGGKSKKDRFELEREARGDSGYGPAPIEYGDEFEREINGGGNARPIEESRTPIRTEEEEEVVRPARGGGRDGLDHTF